MEMFYNIITVFTVNFDQFDATFQKSNILVPKFLIVCIFIHEG